MKKISLIQHFYLRNEKIKQDHTGSMIDLFKSFKAEKIESNEFVELLQGENNSKEVVD